MFHTCAHIYSSLLHLTWNLTLNQKNSQVHTFHWASPSSPLILFLDRSALLICLVHQMIVSGCAGSFVALNRLGSEGVQGPVPEVVMCFEPGRILLLLCTLCLSVFGVLLDLFLVFTIPILFHVLANGAVQSPSTLFCFWWCCFTGVWLFLCLGLNLYGWLRAGSSNSIVIWRDWPIFPQFKGVPQLFSCLRPWGASMNWDVFYWWGLFSGVPSGEGFWPSEFTGALGSVRGGCMVALL